MALQRLFSGDPSRNATLYLVIGGLSLVKAIAVRKDQDRFRRELLDAGLFIGIGLVLRRYSQLKAEKRAEIEDQLPGWLVGGADSSSSAGTLRDRAKRRFAGEPEPEPTLAGRAKRAVTQRR